MIQAKTLVLHVKKGYEDREQHIRRLMETERMDYDWILDGDMDDLTDDVLDKYFTGAMHSKSPAASCTMKHLLAYQYIVRHNLPGAIVLEDDMILYKNFAKVFAECMDELKRKQIDNALISFEDSPLIFVPRSQRRRGEHLYLAQRDRFAGCYYITNGCARLILEYVEKNKCDLISDVFHRALITRIGLPYYWCHPTTATQGTHNGLFPSSLKESSARKQKHRARTWKLKLAYKKLLYFCR